MRLGHKTKKIVTFIVLLMVVVSVVQPLTAQAQTRYTDAQCAAARGPGWIAAGTGCVQATGGIYGTQYGQLIRSGPSICEFDSPSTWDICVTNIVYVFTVGLMTPFAYIAGYFLDLVVQISLQGSTYALQFISQGWTVVRDLANMLFLFILIYIAFVVMFKAETSGTMRMLAAVIVVALLVNFSFFLTRVVIDAGNILATQFYNAIPSTKPMTGILAYTTGSGAQTKDLTAPIMNALNVHSLFNTDSFNKFHKGNGFLVVVITLSLLYVAVGAAFAILAFAFLTVGFKFLMRIVVLWFLIIASPLAFVARTLQGSGGNKIAGLFYQWLDALIKFSFYPAVFLFMFWIITIFMNSVSKSSGGNLLPAVFTDANSALKSNPDGSFIMPILSAIVVMGIKLGFVIAMLWLALRASDLIVTEGTKAGRSFANSIGRAFGFGTYGVAAWGARNTVGLGAYALSRLPGVQRLAANSLFGRGLQSALQGVASSRLDVRGIPSVRSGLGYMVDLPGGRQAPVAGDIGGPGGKLGKIGRGGLIGQIQRRQKAVKEGGNYLKGDAVDVQKAQQQAIEQYGRKQHRTDTEKLSKARELAESFSQKVASASNAAEAQRYRDAAERARNTAKTISDRLQPTTLTAAQKIVDQTSKERTETFAKRLSTPNWQNLYWPSRGSIGGAADIRGKSKKERLAEAALEVEKERRAEEGGDEPEPPESGGGARRPTPRSGGPTDASGTSSTSTGSGPTSQISRSPTLVKGPDSEELKLLRRIAKAMERSAKTAQNIAATTGHTPVPTPDKNTIRAVQQLAKNAEESQLQQDRQASSLGTPRTFGNTQIPESKTAANDNEKAGDERKAA